MKFVIDSDIPFVRGVFEPFGTVAYVKGREISRADMLGADALIVRTRTRCDRALLEGTGVRIIATATIGSDHIDTQYCREAGIKVATAAGANARGVLQWVAAALANCARREGWKPHSKCMGVVGVGNVGSLVARYAAHWGFGVLCCDPPRKEREGAGTPPQNLYGPVSGFVDLGEIISRCDIITLHTPLTSEGPHPSLHMLGPGELSGMKRGALIVNTSRGEVVDTLSLLRAIPSGRCSTAIDTWENEPCIDGELLRKAVIATPHIAGYTAQGKANASALAVRAVAAELRLPIGEWYPGGVRRVAPHLIRWEEMTGAIGAFFDIEAETLHLKRHPEQFEELRNNYRYREEFF